MTRNITSAARQLSVDRRWTERHVTFIPLRNITSSSGNLYRHVTSVLCGGEAQSTNGRSGYARCAVTFAEAIGQTGPSARIATPPAREPHASVAQRRPRRAVRSNLDRSVYPLACESWHRPSDRGVYAQADVPKPIDSERDSSSERAMNESRA